MSGQLIGSKDGRKSKKWGAAYVWWLENFKQFQNVK